MLGLQIYCASLGAAAATSGGDARAWCWAHPLVRWRQAFAIISVLSNEHRSHCLANWHWGSHWEGSLETLEQIRVYQIRELKITAITCAFSVSISCSHPLVLLSLRCYFCHIAAGRVRTCTEADVGSNSVTQGKDTKLSQLILQKRKEWEWGGFLFFLVPVSSPCSTTS